MSGSEPSLEQRLLRAARRILRPLVHVMIRNGINANAFQELMRKVYIDVAYEDFAIDGKAQSLARVSVLTGLNRKEVSRLRKVEPLEESDSDWWNRAGRVLEAWFSKPEFQNRLGHPVDLPYKDGDPSFVELVRKHSGDMYPRTVADELLRIGAIEEVGERFRLTSRGYMPETGSDLAIDILGLDTAELMDTIVHNLQATSDNKRYQFKLVSLNFPEDKLDEFNRYSRTLTGHLFDQLAAWLRQHDLEEDWSGDDARYVAGLSAFQVVRRIR